MGLSAPLHVANGFSRERAMRKLAVVISPEFTSFIGPGGCDPSRLPRDSLIIGFGDLGDPSAAILGVADLEGNVRQDLIVLAIERAACLRLFGLVPDQTSRWFLPADQRGLGRAILAIDGSGEVPDLLRGARSAELLCAFFHALCDGAMVDASDATTLGEGDVARVAAARLMIREHWHEPLTVDILARRSGISKAKLQRGFRELFRYSVAEALSEERLGHARQLLAQSDLPISTVGYRCGYTSSASFTRAFARRFGMVPSEMRRRETAAVTT